MASFKALCLAGVASLVATVASAADLLPPPPPVEYVPPPPVAFGGWYLRGDVGVGINDLRQRNSSFAAGTVIPDLRYDDRWLDDSGIIDAGVGYRINQYFRADVTGEYRSSSHFGAIESYNQGYFNHPKDGSRGVDLYGGSVNSVVGLVNGYVDAGTWYSITPFVGAGVGVSYIGFNHVTDQGAEAAAGGFGYGGYHSQTNFAFALMAGLDFAVTQNLSLELSYRYLDQGNIQGGKIRCQNGGGVCPNEVQHYRLASNDIRLGFRYILPEVLPFVPAPPLVRKY